MTKTIRVDKMTERFRLDKMTKENLKLGKKTKSTKDKKRHDALSLSLSFLSISLSSAVLPTNNGVVLSREDRVQCTSE
jgi:hypothetical protein